ncbi:hypothetical protein M431DRAFT_522755 [Trichoderma harzianum CBS 226.95]|uniref:Uncharacterized protein n=1 Tax=Trichoderma harzianum CBS 226.95 TaxID=983964 RepID=A0A2T4A407_TRIHA|nr:hypothetical protein M431DRAFT_522755 [Trichoderma harzianum CBS 226.95]PTB51791.1 hypothetical protein M431DRAFT_522755 [Trichoderma harzianum CBS 226.95]
MPRRNYKTPNIDIPFVRDNPADFEGWAQRRREQGRRESEIDTASNGDQGIYDDGLQNAASSPEAAGSPTQATAQSLTASALRNIQTATQTTRRRIMHWVDDTVSLVTPVGGFRNVTGGGLNDLDDETFLQYQAQDDPHNTLDVVNNILRNNTRHVQVSSDREMSEPAEDVIPDLPASQEAIGMQNNTSERLSDANIPLLYDHDEDVITLLDADEVDFENINDMQFSQLPKTNQLLPSVFC